jgi:hypothetical protein
LRAQKLEADAEERAAKAKREAAIAEEQRIEANRVRDDVRDLTEKADDLDPDVARN